MNFRSVNDIIQHYSQRGEDKMNDSQRRVNSEVQALLAELAREPAFDGTVLEGRQRRYTVINEKDRKKYLTKKENEEFDSLLFCYLGKIEEGRVKQGKEPFNTYLVINTDEPYAHEIVEVMQKHGHWGE